MTVKRYTLVRLDTKRGWVDYKDKVINVPLSCKGVAVVLLSIHEYGHLAIHQIGEVIQFVWDILYILPAPWSWRRKARIVKVYWEEFKADL